MLKNIFFSLLLLSLLMFAEQVHAWGICIINQTNKITDNSTGQILNIVSNLPGDGENYINSKGGYHCTNKKSGKAGVGYSAQEWVVPPQYVWHMNFTSNRQDKYHPYIEVYCGKNIYYWYENNQWKSESSPWDNGALKYITCN